MNDPTLFLDVNRVRAQQVGLTQRDIAQNVLVTLSSSFQTAPTFWVNPATGVSYNVAVQAPQYRIDSLQALMNTPVSSAGVTAPQLLGNLATIKPMNTPAVVSHYNVMPSVDVYGSVDGRDLGGVGADTNRILNSFKGHLPRGTQISLSGQVNTMQSSFTGLLVGLVMSIVLVYLLNCGELPVMA